MAGVRTRAVTHGISRRIRRRPATFLLGFALIFALLSPVFTATSVFRDLKTLASAAVDLRGGVVMRSPLSDAEAAVRVRRSAFEPRPENHGPNHRVPTSSELARFRSLTRMPAAYRDKVTGNFTGTTDEIIQWTAHKWGIDEDVVRAEAVQESRWNQSALGDGGISYGLMQIKSTVSKGTYPLSRDSTAFNADYYGASIRHYYDGAATWLNDACCFSGTTYKAGDLWGSAGAWFAGRWYSTGAVDYINKVKDHLRSRTWERPGF